MGPVETISDAERESNSADPVFLARLRHELVIAWMGLGVCLFGFFIIGWRVHSVEAREGKWMLVIAGLTTLVYLQSLFDPRRGATWKCWLRGGFEVSVTSFIVLLDRYAGPQLLVTSSAAYLYTLVVMLNCMRLRPRLLVAVTTTAIVQQAAIYLSSLPMLEGIFSTARVQQELIFRLMVLAVVGVVGWFLSGSLKRDIRGAFEEARVRTAFGSYVDRRVVARVLAGDLRVAAERRIVTVMFVDIRGFTAFTEKKDPAEVFALLGEVLNAFSLVVQRQGGIVNKFLGDGLLAFFGAPESQTDHPRRAVRAALQIAAAARERAADGRFPELAIGIGIHTGEAVVGDLGSARREYTAIGDVVNVASRVEAMNKELDTRILVTEAVISGIGDDVDVRKFPAVTLRGRSEPMTLFEVQELRGTSELSGSRPMLRPR